MGLGCETVGKVEGFVAFGGHDVHRMEVGKGREEID